MEPIPQKEKEIKYDSEGIALMAEDIVRIPTEDGTNENWKVLGTGQEPGSVIMSDPDKKGTRIVDRNKINEVFFEKGDAVYLEERENSETVKGGFDTREVPGWSVVDKRQDENGQVKVIVEKEVNGEKVRKEDYLHSLQRLNLMRRRTESATSIPELERILLQGPFTRTSGGTLYTQEEMLTFNDNMESISNALANEGGFMKDPNIRSAVLEKIPRRYGLREAAIRIVNNSLAGNSSN